MITDLLIYIVSAFIQAITFILPTWTPWPSALLEGLTYFFTNLAKFNIIFPVDTLLTVLAFVINFEVIYFSSKLIIKILNFFRGTGSGLDI